VLLIFVRAPEQRRADATLSQDLTLTFNRYPQHALQLMANVAGFPGYAGIAG
jgi:hypothetical protein